VDVVHLGRGRVFLNGLQVLASGKASPQLPAYSSTGRTKTNVPERILAKPAGITPDLKSGTGVPWRKIGAVVTGTANAVPSGPMKNSYSPGRRGRDGACAMGASASPAS
jgi:hypothetical protein